MNISAELLAEFVEMNARVDTLYRDVIGRERELTLLNCRLMALACWTWTALTWLKEKYDA